MLETIQSVFQQLQGMRWSDYADIILVALLIFTLLPLLRSTGTLRIAWVIVLVIVFASLTQALKLHTLSFLFNQLLAVGLIALVVLFQPELRRMLEHLSRIKLKGE